MLLEDNNLGIGRTKIIGLRQMDLLVNRMIGIWINIL